MKVILSESRFGTIFSEWLENEKINTHITYYGSDLSNQDGLVEKVLDYLSNLVKEYLYNT